MQRMSREYPTQARLKELLTYSPSSGQFVWRSNRGGKAYAGRIAGETRKDGYKVIVVDRVKFYAHRLAWLYVRGKWPSRLIDHINGDPSDNRIENLREATNSQNISNSGMRPHNKSGLKGVSWNKRDKCWRAYIKRDGKTCGLGTFATKEDAYAAFVAEAKRLYGDFWRAA